MLVVVPHFSFIAFCEVNIPTLIIDFMLPDHLFIPSRNLPYEMILTLLFKHFKINLSNKRPITPSIDIDHTLLKRIHVRLCAQAPPHPQLLPNLMPNFLPLVPPFQLSIHMKVS